MINLFHIPEHEISTKVFDHHLHGSVVNQFEEEFCHHVGAKYGVALNSATNAIFLAMLNKNVCCEIPTVIPPVVCNALLTSGNTIKFKDDPTWVGNPYILHDFGDYKVIDSAQRVDRKQYATAKHLGFVGDSDLMVFSFYPTKPVGSFDGGMIVSNNKEKIEEIRLLAYNGMSLEKSNWDRQSLVPGYKFYMNSLQAHVALDNLRWLPDKRDKLERIRSDYNKYFGLKHTSHHLYQIYVKDNKKAMQILKEKGIQSGIHYHCAHKQPAYSSPEFISGNYEQSLLHEKMALSIPFNEKLTGKDVTHVLDCCLELLR